jgi:xylulokinase
MSHSPVFLISYDIGSTGCKTCLYALDRALTLVDSALGEYTLVTRPDGGVEQDALDWWRAMANSTRDILSRREPLTISGVSFSAQMQGLVLVDHQMHPVRRAMSYMDQRSGQQKARAVGHGITVEGMNLVKLLKSLTINGAAPVSVKDPVWKYKWVQECEPDVFARTRWWLDVKDFLIAKATGKASMTADSAFATFLTEKRSGHTRWSPTLIEMYGITPRHLPPIVASTDVVGPLLPEAAAELGLEPGIPVFGGGGDASMISVGAGATREGDTYVYTGTSGWVGRITTVPKVDVSRHIAAIAGAQEGKFLYFAEQETAGKCLEWVRDHLALDEIGVYLDRKNASDLYDFLIETITQVPAGSTGVIFCPWLHGNRSPFEDPAARGIFFNLSLETGKRAMIRAVVEGIMFHQKWMMEGIRKSFSVDGPVTFVGGGALSRVTAQMLSDILELPVRRLSDPRHAGAAGAAIAMGVGLGLIPTYEDAPAYLTVQDHFKPNPDTREAYRKNYRVFRRLYKSNKKNFSLLNNP